MKNVAIIILLLTTVVFGSLYVGQRRQVGEADTTIADLRHNLAEIEARVTEQEKRASTLQTKLQDTRAKAVAKADQVDQLEQALTNQTQKVAKNANPMAEMFKKPEMRELIRNQQKAAMGAMMEKNYSPFFSGLGLNSEQAAGLKDLIVKKSLIDAEAGMTMLTGDTDPAKRKEIMQQAKADKDAVNEEIKQYLGADNYPQFQSYEKTIPERMTINTFKDQQASGPGALSPDQEAQLVQSMTDTRQNFKFTTDFYDQSKFSGDLASVFTEERVKQFEQEREQLDEQYLANAQAILATNQIGSFQKFLTGQREMQAAGMKMGLQMYGAKTSGEGAK